MVEVLGPVGLPPPQGCDCDDPDIVTPVVIPWGCTLGCCNDCGDEGIPRHHVTTHARDTIIVPLGTARTSIKLDDGTGEGYCFAAPLHCLELRFRYKGERCVCFRTTSVMADWNSGITIMWTREWERLDPGYYEAEIIMNPGTPVERKGGWLLFLKKGQTPFVQSGYTNTAPKPGEVPQCAPLPDMVGTPLQTTADCDTGGCDPCQ